jgi:hypothetical protein
VTHSSPTVNPPRNFDVEVDLLESSMSLSATRQGLSRFIHESYSSKHKRSELEVYLDDHSHPEMDNDAFDIIAWWKLHGPKYPIILRQLNTLLSLGNNKVKCSIVGVVSRMVSFQS